jgi:soluble lytic murein transglycosylase
VKGVERLLNISFLRRRITLIIACLMVVIGAAIAPLTFMRASCGSQRGQVAGEREALATLRTMTRGGVLPSDDAVARIESQFPATTTAGIARLIRARIKINSRDFAGGSALLDSSLIREHTLLGDYALLMRGSALEQMGRKVEARAAYELTRDYPASLRVREATLRIAQMLMHDGQPAAVPVFLKPLADKDDAAALLLSAKALEQSAEQTRALGAYRRIYFYAPASSESVEAAPAIERLNSTLSPASEEEALKRADKLFESKRYVEALNAYTEAFARFPAVASPAAQLRRGISATTAKRTTDAVMSLNNVPASAGEIRAEALYYLVQTYAKAHQWEAARGKAEELHRAFPDSAWGPRAFTSAGQTAEAAKDTADTLSFYRAGVNSYPGSAEVAQAQFALAWLAHETRNWAESSRQLTEHLAFYADKNTDNRGKAGYWAARDSERAGKQAEALALYRAMQGRYGANWYGYLAKQRMEAMARNGTPAVATDFPPESSLGKAIANLQTVTVADETAGPAESDRIARAGQLTNIGMDEWALEELALASKTAPASPRVNLALASIYRAREDNVYALNLLKHSYPDYSQMKPEELTREEWDIFYPLSYWDIIAQQSRARNLDPYQVAGLIRQESVFNPRAISSARAIGLMQVLVPTGALVAKRYGVDRAVTAESLSEPLLNIELGTSYLRDQLDKYGRIEYVAAAYNAGPRRLEQWRSTLPLQIDEWAEAIPFKETRGYVQGVVRNSLQYARLYDTNGQFKPEVGSRAVSLPGPATGSSPTGQPVDSTIRKRRVTDNEEEE